MKAAVIGSGVGGLAISIRLALKGYEVIVYEQNNHAGGKISEIRARGYRFDTGPSLFTLPELTKELFEAAGKKVEDYLPYIKLDNICTYFYEDGTQIRAVGNPERFASEVEEQTGESSGRVLKHLNRCKELFDLTARIFLFNSLHKVRTYLTWRVLKGILQFYKVDAFTTMHERNRIRFKDERIVQLFDRYATYNGSNPYAAPATLNVIAHIEHRLGAFFPTRGMRSVAVALENLARDSGVLFQFSSKVGKIVVESGRAAGLMVHNEYVPCDLIVSDCDIHYLYNHLLTGSKQFRISEKNLSSSALIFYWGLKGKFKSLGLHNILFSGNYEAEFQHIFEKRSIYNDPTVYIFISSKVVPADAPDKAENWFVMINVPPDTGQDWDRIIADTRQYIINKINRILKTRVEDLIVFEQVSSPLTIGKSTLSCRGALYGAHSNSVFSAFLRHPYRHKSIKNLYFVGGSVHPGGGIPLCLASAKIADREIKPVWTNELKVQENNKAYRISSQNLQE
ncbi:MAG: phytoene desaturase [Bacteroidales bacterium]|nr:MAG: phytoene desaturase [Bacteroidales bacterium]